MHVLHGCRINDNGGPDVPALPGVFSAGHNHDVPVPVHRGKKGGSAQCRGMLRLSCSVLSRLPRTRYGC